METFAKQLIHGLTYERTSQGSLSSYMLDYDKLLEFDLRKGVISLEAEIKKR